METTTEYYSRLDAYLHSQSPDVEVWSDVEMKLRASIADFCTEYYPHIAIHKTVEMLFKRLSAEGVLWLLRISNFPSVRRFAWECESILEHPKFDSAIQSALSGLEDLVE